MKKIIALVASVASLLAVSCEKQQIPEDKTQEGVVKSFKVTMPQTKTVMGDGSETGTKAVLFEDGDIIKVFANTSQNAYEFTYSASSDEFSAIIDAEDASETDFYAVYPATYTDKSGDTNTWTFTTGGTIAAAKALHYTDIAAVKNGFDPTLSVMTAKAEADGTLTFRYGVGFFKITTATSDIVSIKFKASGRIGGRPTYNEEGALSTHSDSQAEITMVADGTLDANSVYYVPIIPKTTSNLGNLTLTFTNSKGYSVEMTTGRLSSTKPDVGIIYNLGTPPVSFEPMIEILKSSVNNIPCDAADGLTITDAYSLSCCTDTDVTVTCDNTVVTSASIADGTITYSISANGDEETREGYIYLKLGDSDAEMITIYQLGTESAPIKETHEWHFSDYTDDEMLSITGHAANTAANAGETWDFGDGLTMVTNSSSKWNNQTIDEVSYKWVATGGKYGSSQKYFKFTTESTGTITVLYASGSNSSRALTINVNGTETTDSDNVSTGTVDLKTVTFSSVAAGTIMLYSKAENIRVFSIDYAEN